MKMELRSVWKTKSPNILVLVNFVLFISEVLGHHYRADFINDILRRKCPNMNPNIYHGYVPYGNDTAGHYEKKKDVNDLEQCVINCCEDEECNVVFMYQSTCFTISCISDELCKPVHRAGPHFGDNVQMVLVRPVVETSWSQPWDLADGVEELSNPNDLDVSESRPEPIFGPKTCEYGVMNCPENEVCIQKQKHSRNGLCQCVQGYERDRDGICIPGNKVNLGMVSTSPKVPAFSAIKEIPLAMNGTKSTSEPSTTPSLKQLVVSALSKEIILPENEVTLSAYTIPAEQPGEHYNYEWTLISRPEGDSTGTMNDKNTNMLKLSHLIEGLYTFKVSVTAPSAYGEALANVTVLPPKRINQPPVAVVSPRSQTIKLPNTGAVLDGSSSRDDDTIVSYHWELQQGPIGYQPQLADTATLQLNNLSPGNYTFKLTVEDSDHAKNSTTANITVVKETDYPPEANAGQDKIIYLPQNSVTLNGNLSTDDKRIASWEWTKSPSDHDKAVDMQNTRTPYLQLSNLEEGMYTFVLKVTDNSGQESTAEVHVFVKPPTNNPPTANAGDDIVVSLPQTWALLNGSKSQDDIKIAAWTWEQLGGPSKVQFSANNQSLTNVSGLTKGDYQFRLTVADENGNKANASVNVTVTQNKNAPPKANGGGDQTIVLPVSVVVVNGSQSSDDLGIVQWEWTRKGGSLAMGKVIGNSDHLPVLMLVDVVPGRYEFSLKVTDEQGESSSDTVSIIVKPDPNLHSLVELTLSIEGQLVRKSQEDTLEQQISLLLREEGEIKIHVQDLRLEQNTGHAVVVFYVEKNGKALPGPHVVSRLKEKLHQDSGLLELSVSSIITVVCQNNCSGHGVCDQATRQCLCEAFWMQDLFEKYWRYGESNCDWSILYVVIVLFVTVVLVAGGGWALVCLCQRGCTRRPRKRHRYSLLDEGEETAMIPHIPHGNKLMISESDSDSDVLFETKKAKVNGELKNGVHKGKNGFIKSGRKIKT